jgi:hypothetical protein
MENLLLLIELKKLNPKAPITVGLLVSLLESKKEAKPKKDK